MKSHLDISNQQVPFTSRGMMVPALVAILYGCGSDPNNLPPQRLTITQDGDVTTDTTVISPDQVVLADGSSGPDVPAMVVDGGRSDSGTVDVGMPVDTGSPTIDTGMVNPVDTGMHVSDVPVIPTDRGIVVEDRGVPVMDSGASTCQPTAVRIGIRIGTSNIVNSNTAPISIAYSGDCSDMMNRSVTFSVRPGDTFNQGVTMTSVDASAHVMRGVLNINEFAGFPDNATSMTLSATINGVSLSTMFGRDAVRPVIITGSGNTRVNPLSAGATSYTFNFRGDSAGSVFVSLWRQRDNFPLFRTSGTSTLCVIDNSVQACASDGLGEEQLCLATTATANACVSRRLIFDVAANTSRSVTIPDADFQNAIANSANTDTIRAELVYCDPARNCVQATYSVSRTN